MVTVGFSTRVLNSSYLDTIKSTIGLNEKDYEIIYIENDGLMSLSAAYNKLIDISKNKYVVLIHDDIKVEEGWGRKIIKHLDKGTHDIIGVAGTTILTSNSVWWEFPQTMKGIVKHTSEGKTWESKYSEPQGYNIKDVVVLDGLFLAFNKAKIKHKFDEDFNGFHFYDLGFCFPNYVEGIKLGVVTDIRVKHLSIGRTNLEWETNRQKFSLKYQTILGNNNFGVSTSPLVSIIIPCYNDGEFLNDSIKSAKELIYTNKEIIIVDDGSTDTNTLNIINNLSYDNTVKVIKHETNKGLSAARNTGISNANGYYILPHDVDDTFDKTYLLFAVTEAEKNEKISPVYCDTNHIGFIQGVEERPEWSLTRLKKGPFIVSCSLFRKKAWEDVLGYDETMKGWEDYDLWWRIGNKGYLGKRIPKPLFNYRHIRPSMIQEIKDNETKLYNYIMSKKLTK
jgi:glycosyltransferase involved in cell wall biosynthesis